MEFLNILLSENDHECENRFSSAENELFLVSD